MSKTDKSGDKLIADQAKEIAALKASLNAKEAKASKAVSEQVDYAKQLQGLYSDLNKIKEDEAKTEDKAARLMKLKLGYQQRGNKEAEKEADRMLEILKSRKDSVDVLKEQKSLEADAIKKAQEHNKLLEKRQKFGEKYSEEFKESISFIGDINDKVKEIPIVGGVLSKALGLDSLEENLTKKFESGWSSATKEAESAATDMSDSIGGVADAGEAAAEGAEAVGGGMKSSIPGALGLNAAMGPILIVALAIAAAVELFKKALEMDQEVTDMARGFGITKDEASGIHHEIIGIARDTKVVGANAKELTTAYTELAAITGVSNVNNKEMLETQVLMKKQFGMTSEEASNLQSMSAGMGQTASQTLATTQEMTNAYNELTGDHLNAKEIAHDIAKIERGTLASYKGDIKALTMAAIQSKKIGMNMKETQAVADKLLDIEGSLEAEMKANVLTGKSMNMNKARQLALEGKTAEAAAEAVEQAGDYAEFMALGPLQQKAVADAAGMTVEQLQKAGELKKMSVALGGAEIKDMKDLTAEQIDQLKTAGEIDETKASQMLKDQQAASAQEKMAAMTDKLSALMMKIAAPVMRILDPLMELVDKIMPALEVAMEIAFYPVQVAFGIIESIIDLLSGDFSGAMDALGSAFIPGGGEESHGAEEGASGAAAESMHDGVISGSGTVIKSPKGTYKLADEDTIIAGTELGKPGSGGDVLDALRDMLDKVKGISSSDIDDLEDLFEDIEDAFDELDIDEILDFASLADKNLSGAGVALIAGLNSLTGISNEVDLDELETTFEDIEDAFDELDIDELLDFASLAGKDLAGVGTALIAGINSLTGIGDDIDLGGLEDTFEELDEAFGELDIKDLVAFASLADKDLSKLGGNIAAGINSLAALTTAEGVKSLPAVEDTFDMLEDAIAELDIEELEQFAAANFGGVESNAIALYSALTELGKLGTIDLSDLEDTFEYLQDAMDEIDLDDLNDLMSIDTGAISSLASGGAGTAAPAPASGAPATGNAEVVTLLKQLIAKIEQPVNINIGGRVIQEIDKIITMNKTYNTKGDNTFGAS